jgi:hypothetical protein
MNFTVLVVCKAILVEVVLVYHAIQMIRAVKNVTQMVLSAIAAMK